MYSESWQGKNLLITAVSAGAAIYCVVEISKFLTKVAKEQVVAILKYIGKKNNAHCSMALFGILLCENGLCMVLQFRQDIGSD